MLESEAIVKQISVVVVVWLQISLLSLRLVIGTTMAEKQGRQPVLNSIQVAVGYAL